MAKYKKIPAAEQEKLKELKMAFDGAINIAKQKLQLEQIHQMELSETIEIKSNSFTFSGSSINFVIYNEENENHREIVTETIDLCNGLMLEAFKIKHKYGYENIRSMNEPKHESLFFENDRLTITLSVNQTRKIRPFEDEKITEWREKDYLGFGDFWGLVESNGLTDCLGFTYVANDIRVKIQKEKQFSLNNGVFIGVRSNQKIVLNLRVNPVSSMKRQDYLGDQRTFFTIKNKQKKSLNIYAKNEHPSTKSALQSIDELYKMNFKI